MREERITTERGDSFDIGKFREIEPAPDMTDLLSNPQKLISSFNLSEKQAENVRSLIVAGGTGGIYKLLSRHLGSEIAGILGGFLSAYIAKRFIK